MSLLRWISDIGTAILDTALAAISLIVQMVRSLFALISHLPNIVSMLTTAIGSMPYVYVTPLSLVLSVSIIFWFINRGQSR